MAMNDRFNCVVRYTLAHTCPDYFSLIAKGISIVKSEVLAAATKLEGEEARNSRGMALALEAVASFIKRVGAEARHRAGEVGDLTSENLSTVAVNCEKVASDPPENYHQALQLLWLVNFAVGVSEYSGASLSLGSLDQYLWPLFEKDRGISEIELAKLTSEFFLKLNTVGDAACSVNVGPASPDPEFNRHNRLSALITETVAKNQKAAPLLAVKIRQD